MGLLDKYVKNLTSSDDGLTDEDRKKLKRRGLLQFGLNMLATPTGQGGVFQAAGRSLLGATDDLQKQSGVMANDALARKYQGANGQPFNMAGYRNEYMSKHPEKFMTAGGNNELESYDRYLADLASPDPRVRAAAEQKLYLAAKPAATPYELKLDSNNNPNSFDKRTGAIGQANTTGNAPQSNYSGLPIPETDKYVKNILFNAGPLPPNLSNEDKVARLLPHLVKQESGGNPNAVSPKGAIGLAQVMPATATNPGYGVAPLRDSSPQENVRFGHDYLLALMNQYGGDERKALAAYNAGPGRVDQWQKQPNSPFVARTPEDIKGAEARAAAQAQANVDLTMQPQIERAKAGVQLETAPAIATATTTATENAKNQAAITAKRQTQQADRTNAADATLPLLDEAETYLKTATGSLAGSAIDSTAGAFGQSTEGAQGAAQLRIIAGYLTSKVPRMEGPQSNTDLLNYKQMAGDLGNELLPRETRLAALQAIRKLNLKYASQNQTQDRRATDKPKTLSIEERAAKYRNK